MGLKDSVREIILPLKGLAHQLKMCALFTTKTQL